MNQALKIDTIRLIRERFSPLTAIGGLLLAGSYMVEVESVFIYLDMTQRWLGKGYLTDEQVSLQLDPHAIVSSCLESLRYVISRLIQHAEKLTRADDTESLLLRHYLQNQSAVVVDAVALGKILASSQDSLLSGT